jgi:peptide/nickel transport system substrate-binding protein
VDLRVIGNDSSRLAALLSGDVDLIEGVPTADVARLARDPRVSLFRRNSDRVMFLIPNLAPDAPPLLTDASGQALGRNPLRDLRVRRALSLAIDREALAARALDGQAAPTVQLVPEQFGGYDPELVPAKAADPDGARRLLAEAGYPSGFGLTIGCSNNRYVNDARVCQALGQMLQRAGFAARVETQPGSVFFPRTVAGRNDLPLILFGLSLSSSRDASYLLSTVVHGRDPAGGFGAGQPRRLLGRRGWTRRSGRRAELGGAARSRRWRGAMRAALEQVPLVPLYNAGTVAAARRGILYEPRMDEQTVASHARPAP